MALQCELTIHVLHLMLDFHLEGMFSRVKMSQFGMLSRADVFRRNSNCLHLSNNHSTSTHTDTLFGTMREKHLQKQTLLSRSKRS